jgi:hypothetical protein
MMFVNSGISTMPEPWAELLMISAIRILYPCIIYAIIIELQIYYNYLVFANLLQLIMVSEDYSMVLTPGNEY